MTPDPKNWRDEMYSDGDDRREADDALLARVKAVAQRITDRCQHLTGGTQVDLRPLPPNAAGGAPTV